MNLKTLFILFLAHCFYSQAFAQDYQSQFKSIQNDTAAQSKLLAEWTKTQPEDPELYVAYFNFYVRKSMRELVNLETTQHGDKSLQITDPKTGKVVAYMNDGVTYDKDMVEKGLHYIDIGIEKFPARLDMRFGKIYILGKIYDYENFTQTLIAAIDYSQKINLKWTWTNNKPVDDSKKFMLSAEQTYITQLYEAGDGQAKNMRAIAETVLKYYPDHVENLSNLGITYIITKDYAHALEPLLKAEKVAPTDGIVLNNIAYCYELKGDKLNAIKYYELTEKYGDDRAKRSAKQKLDELNK
ncbi:MAG: tetratricopeptide repeat protein [Mucilaginibacter sp.]